MSWKRKQYNITSDEIKPRHKVYCIDCGRSKLLFQSCQKALNFIKYNGDVIEKESGYKPIRAYECVCCCGWHVTSHGKRVGKRSLIERYLGISSEDVNMMSVYYPEYRTMGIPVQERSNVFCRESTVK